MDPSNRPLSPHLQIYKPQLTSVMSVLHRLSGLVLSLGVLAIGYWLVCAASGESEFESVVWIVRSWWFGIVIFFWTVCLFYHLCNGVRHLAWDAGFGFELNQVYWSGTLTWVVTVIATVLVWLV